MNGLTTEQQRKELSALENEIINYIFLKLGNTYGTSPIKKFIGEHGTLNDLKRDWKRVLLKALKCRKRGYESLSDYGRRAREKVDRIFDELRLHQNQSPREWDFFDLRKFCSFMDSYRDTVQTDFDNETDSDEFNLPTEKRCCANGCPLPGSLTNNTNGGTNFYCRFHDGKHPNDFDATTRKIRLNKNLVFFAGELNRLGPVAWRFDLRIVCPDGYEIADQETFSAYQRRINTAVRELINP